MKGPFSACVRTQERSLLLHIPPIPINPISVLRNGGCAALNCRLSLSRRRIPQKQLPACPRCNSLAAELSIGPSPRRSGAEVGVFPGGLPVEERSVLLPGGAGFVQCRARIRRSGWIWTSTWSLWRSLSGFDLRSPLMAKSSSTLSNEGYVCFSTAFRRLSLSPAYCQFHFASFHSFWASAVQIVLTFFFYFYLSGIADARVEELRYI